MLPRTQRFRYLIASLILIGLCCLKGVEAANDEKEWQLFIPENVVFWPGQIPSNGMWYYLPIGKPLSAYEAKKFCEDRQSHLLNLDRLDQFTIYTCSVSEDLFGTFGEVFWSGMSVSPHSGRLVWHAFGPKYVERNFTEKRTWSWKYGVPRTDDTCGKVRFKTTSIITSPLTVTDLGGVESTTTLPTSSPSFSLSDVVAEVELVPCKTRLPFVCEKPAIEPTVGQIDICPEDWIGNAELPFCIRLETTKKSYSLAKKDCEGFGGQLATVSGKAFGWNITILKLAYKFYRIKYEGEISFDNPETFWITGDLQTDSQGCMSIKLEQMEIFERIPCWQESYSFCTRSIIHSKMPSITAESVQLDKDALERYPAPSFVYAIFNRLPLSNEVVFLKTPNGILNSTNKFQFNKQTNVKYDVDVSADSSELPYFVNLTIPRPFEIPTRKRRAEGITEITRAPSYQTSYDTFDREPDASVKVDRPVRSTPEVDWSYIVNVCGYYSFGIYTLNPPRYVETDPVLFRYDESLMYIYLAKYLAIPTFIDDIRGIFTETDVVLRKLTNDNSYVSYLDMLFGRSFEELSPWNKTTDNPDAVEKNFLFYKAVLDDVIYSPAEVILRVFIIPKHADDRSKDREQSYIPFVEEYARQKFNSSISDLFTLRILSTVACPFMVTNIEDPIKTNVTIPSTRIGQIGYSWERCYKGKGALVSAVCEGGYKTGATWSKLIPNTGCQVFPELNSSASSEGLKKLSETSLTNDNIRSVLENIVILTRNVGNLTEADVIYTAEILYNAWKYDGDNPIDLNDVLEITNNIMQADPDVIYSAQRLKNAANMIIRSVDELTSAHQPTTYNKGLRIVKTFVASMVHSQDGYGYSDIVIGLDLKSSKQNQISNSSLVSVQRAFDVKLNTTSTAIYLSEHVIKGRPTKLAINIYIKTELFSVPQDRFKINSNIATARLEKNKRPVYDLGEDHVTMIFDIKEDSKYLVCGYWNYSANEDSGGWETDGCSMSESVNRTKIICECDHLTNFAVLIDLNAGAVAGTHKVVLAFVTKIGLSLSIVGLALTISTFILFRHLRNGRMQKVLMNLGVAMLCSAVVFLVGIERTEHVIGCKIVAILLHYLILVSFAWMLVEGVLQYLRFVKVLGTYIPRFVLKTMIPAWGIPLVPVIAVLVFDNNLYFGGKGYCWLDVDAMLYAFIIPVAVILFANIAVFILILCNLFMRKNKMVTNQSERKMALLHVKAALSVFVILGLTWVFGFLAVSGAQIFFHYVFAFLNAFQGFFIFLLFTAREKQIRNAWKKLCCKRPSYKARTTGTDSQPLKETLGTPGNSSGTKSTLASK